MWLSQINASNGNNDVKTGRKTKRCNCSRVYDASIRRELFSPIFCGFWHWCQNLLNWLKILLYVGFGRGRKRCIDVGTTRANLIYAWNPRYLRPIPTMEKIHFNFNESSFFLHVNYYSYRRTAPFEFDILLDFSFFNFQTTNLRPVIACRKTLRIHFSSILVFISRIIDSDQANRLSSFSHVTGKVRFSNFICM